MNLEQNNRPLEKCLEIYARTQSLLSVNHFLERLESTNGLKDKLPSLFWEESFIPEIKRRYFSEESIDSLLEKSILLYRTMPDKSDALSRIWNDVEWKYPFDTESYDEFVTRLDELLASESNPPSKSDWSQLDESLMK